MSPAMAWGVIITRESWQRQEGEKNNGTTTNAQRDDTKQVTISETLKIESAVAMALRSVRAIELRSDAGL